MSDNGSKCITDDLSDISSKRLMVSLPNFFNFFDKISTTAYLNWRFDLSRNLENKFFNMADGYFETSIALIEKCLANNNDKKADIWIFPILFNVVHGIEVYLKGFNSLYQIYMDLHNDGEPRESKIEGEHNIKQLCQKTMKLLCDSKHSTMELPYDGNISELIDEMLFVQKFIDILYEHTDDMTFARYPITRDKNDQFYIEPERNVMIDLNVLRQWVLRVSQILNNITSYIDYQAVQMQEWRSEMMSYLAGY